MHMDVLFMVLCEYFYDDEKHLDDVYYTCMHVFIWLCMMHFLDFLYAVMNMPF